MLAHLSMPWTSLPFGLDAPKREAYRGQLQAMRDSRAGEIVRLKSRALAAGTRAWALPHLEKLAQCFESGQRDEKPLREASELADKGGMDGLMARLETMWQERIEETVQLLHSWPEELANVQTFLEAARRQTPDPVQQLDEWKEGASGEIDPDTPEWQIEPIERYRAKLEEWQASIHDVQRALQGDRKGNQGFQAAIAALKEVVRDKITELKAGGGALGSPAAMPLKAPRAGSGISPQRIQQLEQLRRFTTGAAGLLVLLSLRVTKWDTFWYLSGAALMGRVTFWLNELDQDWAMKDALAALDKHYHDHINRNRMAPELRLPEEFALRLRPTVRWALESLLRSIPPSESRRPNGSSRGFPLPEE